MAFGVVLLLLGAVWTHQVSAKCNENTIKSIEGFNLENADLFSKILGKYKIVNVKAGKKPMSYKSDTPCPVITFLKDGEDYKVDYTNIGQSFRKIKLTKEGFVHEGNGMDRDLTYYPVQNDPKCLAFYMCSHGEEYGPELTYVLVPVDDTDYAEKVKAAKEKLKSVGLETDEDIESCATTTSKTIPPKIPSPETISSETSTSKPTSSESS